MIDPVKLQVAAERLGAGASSINIRHLASTLQPADYGDKVMPHFMVTTIPTGLVGLIVSAILSAAMSTISSGMNSSATVFSEDIYKRYFKSDNSSTQTLRSLHILTVIFGLAGMGCGIAMIGVKSILDVWWQLSGVFAGGMLGLFLLSIISKKTGNMEAFAATILGILVIVWMSLSYLIPNQYSYLKNPLNANMVIVVGTLTIFLSGTLFSRLKNKCLNITT
jgi:SSS family solute:Na+ symporter